MNDANSLGIPTYEADVVCGMWCQGGSVKFYPTDHPHYTDIADVWVKGLDALELVNRLRAEVKFQTDNSANLQSAIEGLHGRIRDLEAELAEERKPDCLLCKNYYEREDENDHSLYRGCALRLRLTPSDCINGSEFISVGPVRLYEKEGKV